MPRIVDHKKRRAEIADALVRLAGREGLHTVTMRSVAAEAGVSLRLVQYYFKSKAQLMNATLQHLERKSHERWQARLARLPRRWTLRRFLETFFAEALPNDEESRTFHLVWTSYAVLAMTDPRLAEQPFVEGPNRLERQLVEALKRGQVDGELSADLDISHEAVRLLALSHGLGTSVLVGQRSTESAMAVLQGHLNDLLGRPAGIEPPSGSSNVHSGKPHRTQV